MRYLTGSGLVRTSILVCATLLMGLVILGFTGHFFAAGDSIALLRPQVGLLLLLFGLILLVARAWGYALASLVFALVAVGSVAAGLVPAPKECEDGCLTLYQKNLMSQAWPRYGLADDILLSNADIVTLQEVSRHNQKYMSNVFAHYPNSAMCEFRPEQNVAILTTLPVVEGSEFCVPGDGLVGAQLITPKGDAVWIVSVHLRWPYPYSQFEQSKRIAERIEELQGPVVIAGDFNMASWGASVRRIGLAAGNHVFGSVLNTHNLGSWMMPMPIDNLLLPKGTTGTTELRPFMGSDHLGIVARISLP